MSRTLPSTGWAPRVQAQIDAEFRRRENERMAVHKQIARELAKPRKYRNKPEPFKSAQGFSLVAASKREERRYTELDAMIGRQVKAWVPQVSFLLQGGSRYRCDALVFWADGRVTIEDVKGVETPSFKLKRGLLKSTYGLDIEIVR